MSMPVNVADQSAILIAHSTTHTKRERGYALKVSFLGALDHSRVNRLRIFTLTDEQETGKIHVIEDIEKINRVISDRAKRHLLPHTSLINPTIIRERTKIVT